MSDRASSKHMFKGEKRHAEHMFTGTLFVSFCWPSSEFFGLLSSLWPNKISGLPNLNGEYQSATHTLERIAWGSESRASDKSAQEMQARA